MPPRPSSAFIYFAIVVVIAGIIIVTAILTAVIIVTVVAIVIVIVAIVVITIVIVVTIVTAVTIVVVITIITVVTQDGKNTAKKGDAIIKEVNLEDTYASARATLCLKSTKAFKSKAHKGEQCHQNKIRP
jgi:hypothetical protein